MRVVDWLFVLLAVAGVALFCAGLVLAIRRHARGTAVRRPSPSGAAGPSGAAARRRDPVNLAISLAGLALAYVGVAKPADWPPFEPDAGPQVRIDLAASMFHPADGRNPSREYVCLVNETDAETDLLGWTLHDAKELVNELPRFRLPPHGQVRVHPGRGRPSRTAVYGNRRATAWNDRGDAVRLVDADGKEVDSRSYGPRPPDDATASCG